MTRENRDFLEKDNEVLLPVGYLVSHLLLGSNSYCTHGLLFSSFFYVTKYVVHLDADSPVLGFSFLFVSLLSMTFFESIPRPLTVK